MIADLVSKLLGYVLQCVLALRGLLTAPITIALTWTNRAVASIESSIHDSMRSSRPSLLIRLGQKYLGWARPVRVFVRAQSVVEERLRRRG